MKKIIGILSFITLLLTAFVIYGFFFYEPYPQKDLRKLGYTKEETNTIVESFNEEEIKTILKYPYDKELLTLKNHKQYQKQLLKTYLEARKQKLSIEDTIYLVNHNQYDNTLTYDEFTLSLLKGKYYKEKNLMRYLQYHEKNQNLSYDKVIAAVNVNNDIPFYEQTKPADIKKDLTMLVNKHFYLTKDFVPNDLVKIDKIYGQGEMRKPAYDQFVIMVEEAKKEGYTIVASSAYRNYQTQVILYQNYVKRDGATQADTYSARAGYSEHQTGLTVDVKTPNASSSSGFGSTKEFTWMQKHAHEYGFILRYPEDKVSITGYKYEPWHYRYVGKSVAKTIYQQKITLDEYYAYYLES